jgi:hypothetical protein
MSVAPELDIAHVIQQAVAPVFLLSGVASSTARGSSSASTTTFPLAANDMTCVTGWRRCRDDPG